MICQTARLFYTHTQIHMQLLKKASPGDGKSFPLPTPSGRLCRAPPVPVVLETELEVTTEGATLGLAVPSAQS